MRGFKFVTPIEDMARISRKDIGEKLDEILDKVDKEDVGFVISDDGKNDLVLILARWFTFPLDDDFGCVINSAVRYAIGRHTYMPGVVCNFVRRYIDILDTKTINVMIEDINRELQYGIDQENLWVSLRTDLIERQQKMMTKECDKNE